MRRRETEKNVMLSKDCVGFDDLVDAEGVMVSFKSLSLYSNATRTRRRWWREERKS